MDTKNISFAFKLFFNVYFKAVKVIMRPYVSRWHPLPHYE